MKETRFLVLALAVAFTMMLATGCTDSSTTSPVNDSSGMLVTDAQTSADLYLPMDIYDGTIDNEIRFKPNPHDSCDQNGPNGRKPNPADMPHGPFDRLLKAMQLTSDQVSQVRTLLTDHKHCVDAAIQVLRDGSRTILESANAARRGVLADLKAGTITPSEARAAIRAINERARQALRDSDIAKEVRDMLNACDRDFVSNLKGILTPAQLDILQRWIDHRGPGGPPAGGGDGKRPG